MKRTSIETIRVSLKFPRGHLEFNETVTAVRPHWLLKLLARGMPCHTEMGLCLTDYVMAIRCWVGGKFSKMYGTLRNPKP